MNGHPIVPDAVHRQEIASEALASACQEVCSTGSGLRNATLNTQALYVGHFIGSRDLAEDAARARLMAAATAAGLPRSEAAATIRSAFRKGISEPAFDGERPTPVSHDAPVDCHPLFERLLSELPVTTQPNVLEYLHARGIPDNACADLFALPPAAWQPKLVASIVERFPARMVEASGLFRTTPGGRAILWPDHRLGIVWRAPDGYIQTIERRLIGLASANVPRWVFASKRGAEWPLGANLLWQSDRSRGVVIVEGPSDYLAMRWILFSRLARGKVETYPVTVALPSACALKPEWLMPLVGRRVTVALDADEAGDKAADNIVSQLSRIGIDAVRRRPPGKDWAATLSAIAESEAAYTRAEREGMTHG